MEDFNIERVIGEGSYGKAILARSKKDNKNVIIKVLIFYFLKFAMITLTLYHHSKLTSRNYHQKK